jgi:hypothetical protein
MKEHAEEKKCLKCGQFRFVEVVNDEGEKVMTDVAHCNIPKFQPKVWNPNLLTLFYLSLKSIP